MKSAVLMKLVPHYVELYAVNGRNLINIVSGDFVDRILVIWFAPFTGWLHISFLYFIFFIWYSGILLLYFYIFGHYSHMLSVPVFDEMRWLHAKALFYLILSSFVLKYSRNGREIMIYDKQNVSSYIKNQIFDLIIGSWLQPEKERPVLVDTKSILSWHNTNIALLCQQFYKYFLT